VSESATDPKWSPGTIRIIDSADAIKAIADPLRVRLLQLLMVSIDRTWSVKEMAAELGQPVTKLYHHVKLLETADLIRDVDTRIVSGIVEHRYRACQRSLRFDDTLFGSDDTRYESIEHVTALLDAIRDDLGDYLYREDADPELVNMARMTVRLTPEELTEVNELIENLAQRFQDTRDDIDRSHLPRTSILFLMSPLGHDPS
jgi:predicted ArsR family transcriptional regulator